jgi:hypothetical protein
MMATPGASDDAALSRTTPRKTEPPSDVEALRADIEHTRTELGETIQALAARADVKARLQETADDAKARVREGLHTAALEAKTAAAEAPKKAQVLAERTGQAVRRNPVPFAVAAAGAVLVVLFIRWRRNR